MSEMCPTEKQSRIIDYLHTRVTDGKKYFKAKFIADDVGLSSREVGTNMGKLAADRADEHHLNIEKQARSRSTTWKVTVESPRATPVNAD